MPKDVLITPASSKIEFKDVSSNIDGLIQLDGSDNLSITSPNGVLNLGNAAGHVYIGDGTNVTDLIFDQSGTIKAAAGKTLTIGQTGSNVVLAGTLSAATIDASNGILVEAYTMIVLQEQMVDFFKLQQQLPQKDGLKQQIVGIILFLLLIAIHPTITLYNWLHHFIVMLYTLDLQME